MGTLTAGQPRLAEYCEHKLPTSCRLTSIHNCCACADERGYSAAYPTYIDGVGFVPRGTRWQRYCWFCKEFWENRVRASGLRPAQTRIPEVPDQREFLDRWYEFHQGYRTVTKEDGSEERVAVLGEDFREVSPGYLPRTLEELRAGRAANDMAEQPRQQQNREEPEDSGPSLEDTLDQMFQAASLEEDQPSRRRERSNLVERVPDEALAPVMNEEENERNRRLMRSTNVHAQAMTASGSRNRDYQNRRIAALRRELHRMRNGIERVITGLRDLGENVPDSSEANGRLTELGRTLDNIDDAPTQQEAELAINSVNTLTNQTDASQSDRTLASIQTRIDAARQQVNEARRNRDQAATELDASEQEFRTSQQRLQQLQREQRTTENYLRLFGTREEMLEQGEQYESPIGGMFSRAMERFRAAEEVRRDERTLRRVLADEATAGTEEHTGRLPGLDARQRDVWGVPVQTQPHALSGEGEDDGSQEPRGELEEYYALLRQQGWNQQVSEPERVPQLQDGARGEGNNSSNPASENFPRNMLNAVAAQRERNESTEDPSTNDDSQVAELPASQPEAAVMAHDRDADIDHLLLSTPRSYDSMPGRVWSLNEMQGIMVRRGTIGLTVDDERRIDETLNNLEIVWRSGLPTARLLRQRRIGMRPSLQHNTTSDDVTQRTCNAEIMAEAFQMSSEVRRRAPQLNAAEQLRMLYRLQASDRTMADYDILQRMLDDPETVELASRVHEQTSLGDAIDISNARQSALEHRRQDAARQGDHSRQELNAQRRATQALAVAAGRTAMRAGPATLLEQMADRDEETRVAYDRLRQNGFAPEGDSSMAQMLRRTMYRPLNLADYGDLGSPSNSDEEEEDEEQGLDARDTGRPEPKTEEEMMLSMECRVCYTQLAEIACLPCGHLVMCKWCSDQHSPVMPHDRTRPRRAAGCPVCRKGIRQKVKVFRA
ncbi:hypothetical protein KC367_g3394 [Hortaea werneckii]|nr:hypothetical protein KC342_g11893 [Hortaea werneckii]KAI7085678.1 hypothetical protein KC339_g12948 [Hortaea werneckii]KAI7228041.1 hypothetical protein KC365_g8661 [Hortaea werneckii]KAI7308059.1 hypothetical protein KC340_g11165 [Hortaea werneckii]KAI7393851.1 hypothetical protein KC328_g6405 [Hortaea werneckii]